LDSNVTVVIPRLAVCLFAVTLISGIIMFVLFVSELNYYLTKDIQQELFVDTSRGQKLKINLDVTLMKVGCMCKYLRRINSHLMTIHFLL